MQKILLPILLFFPAFLFAQKITLPLDSTTNLVTYQEVVKVDSASKDELYLRAREWFTKTFNSPQDFIEIEDKRAGKIIGKRSSLESYKYMMTTINFHLNYTISVTTKDNRYKYEISSFSVNWYVIDQGNELSFPLEMYNTSYNKGRGTDYSTAKRIIPQVDVIAQGLIKGLKSALKQSTAW